MPRYERGYRPGLGMPWLGSVGHAQISPGRRHKRRPKKGSTKKRAHHQAHVGQAKKRFSPKQLAAQRAFAARNRGRKGKAK